MKGLKIIFFPIGKHDIAGNKRLRNLSKYLHINDNVTIVFLKLLCDKQKSEFKFSILFYLNRLVFLICNIFHVVHTIFKERNAGSLNILYFYELENLMLHRVLIARALGYKIIVDLVENPDSVKYVKPFYRKIKVTYSYCMYRFLPLYSEAIIVVSNYLKRKVLNDFGEKINCFLLPVSFDPEDFTKVSESFPEFSVFYGGSYGDNYDFDTFFECLNEMMKEQTDIRLYLSGKISTDFTKNIKNKFDFPDKVVFLGFLSEEQYFKSIKGMDLLCLPRNDSIQANAGFPFKLAEYLATGKPVITSKVSDIEEYLTEEDAYIYSPGDQKTLKRLLDKIFSDRQIAAIKGKQGQQKAEQYFNAKSQSGDFFNFLNEQI